jgi:hypothetical protein
MTFVTNLRGPILGASLCFALAGCGGGGGDADRPAPLSELAETMVERLDRDAPFNTGFTGQPGQMPATGSATFSGFAGFDVQGARPVMLTGRATLTADFGNSTITGAATGFEGERNGDLTRYAGTIRFVNGTIGTSPAVPGSVPNDIRFRYEGTLAAPGTEVVVGSDATGKFRGTPIRGLLAASSEGAVAEVNGVTTPAPFAVVAERD